MLKRYLTKGNLNVTSKLFTPTRNSFCEFRNADNVAKLLQTYKGKINPNSFQELVELAKPQQIHLFKMFWFTKWFFIITRYQIMGYCIGGGLYAIYLTGSKWTQLTEREGQKISKKERKEIDKNKMKIIASIVVLLISGTLACYVTHTMGQRLVKNIYWDPLKNKIQLDYFTLFCRDKPIYVDPKKIRHIQKPRRFDSTVQYEITEPIIPNKLFATRGTGTWSNKEIFEYIIEHPAKKDQ